MNELPKVGCLAQLDDVVEAAVKAGTLQCGPIAAWEHSGARIIVKGLFQSRGSWSAKAIRWVTEGREKDKGLFAKGLACYMCNITFPASLPVVK